LTIVKLCRRSLVPALGLTLLLVPAPQPSAADGIGRVVVTPARVTAGSTSTFTLTFIADTGALEGQTLLDIPRGWSAPQLTRPGVTGYVSVAAGSCSSATKLTRVVGQRLIISTSCRRGQSFQLTYGPATASTLAADGYVFLTQTKPTLGLTKTTLVKVKTIVKGKNGRKRTKTTTRRITTRIKPSFRPLAAKKQPIVVVTGGPVDHLALNAPTIATAGTPFGITVRAEDAYGNPALGYGSAVSFSSSDSEAFLPEPYRFQSTDLGAKTFSRVILRHAGTQTITVTDDAGRADVSNPITVYSFLTG
jgi:hypothetical protein